MLQCQKIPIAGDDGVGVSHQRKRQKGAVERVATCIVCHAALNQAAAPQVTRVWWQTRTPAPRAMVSIDEARLVMSDYSVPPPAELSDSARHAIIGDIKAVLTLLQQHGALAGSLSYKDVTHNRHALAVFLDAFQANQALVGHLLLDAAGHPVVSRDAPLRNGVTLAQLEQLLVRTCARKYFIANRPKAKRIKKRPTIQTLIKDIVTRAGKSDFPKETAILPLNNREVMRFLAHRWQLDLLPCYRKLSRDQIAALGADLLALDRQDQLERVAQIPAVTLSQAKTRLDRGFAPLLHKNIAAIEKIGRCSAARYHFFAMVIGKNIEEFFSRDQDFLNECNNTSEGSLTVFKEVLTYIELENFRLLISLPSNKIDAIIKGLRKSFGDHLRDVLSRKEASPIFLQQLVDIIDKLDCDEEALLSVAADACHTIFRELKEKTQLSQGADSGVVP